MTEGGDGYLAEARAQISPPSTNDIRLETITEPQRLYALKPHWDDLCRRSPGHNFSHSFEWCWSAWALMGVPLHHRLFCVVGWREDRMVLIWPSVIYRRGLWSTLKPLGSVTTEYSDVLVEDGPDANRWVAQAWQMLRATCESDTIYLPYVRADSRLYPVVSRDHPMVAWTQPVSSVSWDGYRDWDSYRSSRKKHFRYLLRAKRRQLAERGNLSFEAVTQPDQFPPVFDWLLSRKNEWLIRTKRDRPWRATELYRKFLIAVATQRNSIGNIALFVLKLDDRIISTVLCRISRSGSEGLIATFDRCFAAYGPGQLLLEDVLKWAFDQGIAFDFRIGSAPYKRYWTNREANVVSYRFVNSSWGAVFSRVSRLRAGLQIPARSLLQTLRQKL